MYRPVIALAIFSLLYGISSCKRHKPASQDFAAKKKIEEYKATTFVPADTYFAKDSDNIIYCPVFLFAWQELREKLGGSITVPEGSAVQGINQNNSYVGSLPRNEYTTSVKTNDLEINVVAAFEKNLPFTGKFKHYGEDFFFNGASVSAFGMPEYNEDLAKLIEVLYYGNNDTFIIKLATGNPGEEVILAKGFNGSFRTSLHQVNDAICSYISKGIEEKKNKDLEWKFRFQHGEYMIIPVINFNIACEYKNLLGIQIAGADGKRYRIMNALQETAFMLNEEGAKVKAQAEVTVIRAAAMLPRDNQHQPKHLAFNGPYTIILRKAGQRNPYLMVKVQNAELMVKPR